MACILTLAEISGIGSQGQNSAWTGCIKTNDEDGAL